MPNFRTLYADCAKKLFLLLLLGSLFLAGCGGRQEDIFLFEEGALPAALESTAAPQAAADAPAEVRKKDGAEAHSQQEASDTAVQGGTAVPGCIVHICGAVQNPGVYELPAGSRLIDAVEAGGGFLPEADQDACNLAALVADGCQIYIMTEEESEREGQGQPEAGIWERDGLRESDSSGSAEDGKVNLNTADADSLKTLPGVGDSRAAAIIAFREEHGRFQRIEDVMKVSGIKQAAFDKMKDRITV